MYTVIVRKPHRINIPHIDCPFVVHIIPFFQCGCDRKLPESIGLEACLRCNLMCNRIAVMFNGKIVEIAKTENLLSNPIHPYTKRLISSIPVPDPKYTRTKYEIDFTELDEIIASNTNNLPMVDIGDEHFVATHDVKDLLI